jgi:DNA-binding PadR family transcriptional regulator
MVSPNNFLILGLLSNKSMSGYDIKKLIKTRMGSFWDISYSQIYPTLRMLQKEGAVTKKVEINETGPNRKVYSITNEGLSKLQEWLLTPAEHGKFKIEVLLKVAFGEQIPKFAVISHIEEFKTRNISALQRANSFEKEFRENMNKGDRYFFGLLTTLLGKSLHRASVEWADAAIKLIESRKN